MLLTTATVIVPTAAAAIDRISDVPTSVVSLSSKDIETLSSGRNLEDLLKAIPCPAQTMPAFIPSAPLPKIAVRGVGVEGSLSCLKPDDVRMIDVLNEHNRVRAAFGSQPLVWDPQLAIGAKQWAMQMPQYGLAHSPRDSRPSDVRENLQHGLRGWSGIDLTKTWVNEGSYFVPGTFPNVSSNGDWTAVAHFTQMVWPTTTRLGCGSYISGRDDWFVCRYAGPGNRDGDDIRPFNNLGGVIADGPQSNQGADIPRLDPRDLPKDKGGGGMQQIDPPAGTAPPPPPPPPTARDPAPNGNETAHPLGSYFMNAYRDHRRAYFAGDLNGQAEALSKMYYALQELVKRKKAARQARGVSAVDPAKVQEVIDTLNKLYRDANELSRPKDQRPPEREYDPARG